MSSKKEFSSSDIATAIKIGDRYYLAKDFGKALTFYTNALKMSPNNPIVYMKLANTQTQLGQTQIALTNYSKAVEFNCTNVEAYKLLMECYVKIRSFPKAQHIYELAHKNLGPEAVQLYDLYLKVPEYTVPDTEMFKSDFNMDVLPEKPQVIVPNQTTVNIIANVVQEKPQLPEIIQTTYPVSLDEKILSPSSQYRVRQYNTPVVRPVNPNMPSAGTDGDKIGILLLRVNGLERDLEDAFTIISQYEKTFSYFQNPIFLKKVQDFEKEVEKTDQTALDNRVKDLQLTVKSQIDELWNYVDLESRSIDSRFKNFQPNTTHSADLLEQTTAAITHKFEQLSTEFKQQLVSYSNQFDTAIQTERDIIQKGLLQAATLVLKIKDSEKSRNDQYDDIHAGFDALNERLSKTEQLVADNAPDAAETLTEAIRKTKATTDIHTQTITDLLEKQLQWKAEYEQNSNLLTLQCDKTEKLVNDHNRILKGIATSCDVGAAEILLKKCETRLADLEKLEGNISLLQSNIKLCQDNIAKIGIPSKRFTAPAPDFENRNGTAAKDIAMVEFANDQKKAAEINKLLDWATEFPEDHILNTTAWDLRKFAYFNPFKVMPFSSKFSIDEWFFQQDCNKLHMRGYSLSRNNLWLK